MEVLFGLRPTDKPSKTVPAEARRLPVLGEYDVVVVGGGTAGACAAIGAARQGAKALVVEYQEALGGTGTLGAITRPYHGLFIGFTKEVPFPDKEHNVEHKMEWYRREIRKAGGEVWFGTNGGVSRFVPATARQPTAGAPDDKTGTIVHTFFYDDSVAADADRGAAAPAVIAVVLETTGHISVVHGAGPLGVLSRNNRPDRPFEYNDLSDSAESVIHAYLSSQMPYYFFIIQQLIAKVWQSDPKSAK